MSSGEVFWSMTMLMVTTLVLIDEMKKKRLRGLSPKMTARPMSQDEIFDMWREALKVVFLTKQPSKMIACSRVSDECVLPFDVMANILSRLPVKFVARFRGVCKQWQSLTRDPHFVKEHHKRALKRRPIFFPIYTHSAGYLPLYDYGVDGRLKGSFPSVPLGKGVFHFSNTVDGLICGYCHFKTDASHYLFNVSTGEMAKLPGSRIDSSVSIHSVGLGFDPSTGAYKLIKLHNVPGKWNIYKCAVLTVGTREWRDVGETPCAVPPRRCTYVNGAIHWVAVTDDYRLHGKINILAFDLKDEKFRLMSTPLPTDISQLAVTIHQFGSHGQISLVVDPKFPKSRDIQPPPLLRIWTLVDYQNCEWRQEYEIDISYLMKLSQTEHVIDIQDGKILIQRPHSILIYDVQSKELTEFQSFPDYRTFPSLEVATESLVSPIRLMGNQSLP